MLVDLYTFALPVKMGLLVMFRGFSTNTFSILLYGMKKCYRTNLITLHMLLLHASCMHCCIFCGN
jgi:hypothetical protein